MQRKIFDCHMHTLSGTPEKLQAIADHFGFEKYAVLGCPCFAGGLNNLHVLLAKALHPDHVYAFGGLTYGPDERSGEAHVMQVRRLLEAGFDGIKFIESKPGLARDLKVQMDSDELEPVLSLLEEEQVPILWHVGDPATFWNEKLAPAFAVANGWLYTDPSFPTLETLYAQTERVLSRHPQLKVCLAHFYFTADDIDHARRMMEKVEIMEEKMKAAEEDYFPDIFAVSSKLLIDIISSTCDDVPSYISELSYTDYFGDKAVGRSAMQKIMTAWKNERKQFKVDRKNNKLIYSYPDQGRLYELTYIQQELPPILNAQLTAKSIVMDLDQAINIFETSFRRSVFDI
jgi:hypothetical protein